MSALDEMALSPPEPGERCQLCNRRRQKPRLSTSPDSRAIKAGKLPLERAEILEEGLDNLQEWTGADKLSYPRGFVIEAMLGLAASHREEIRDYIDGLA